MLLAFRKSLPCSASSPSLFVNCFLCSWCGPCPQVIYILSDMSAASCAHQVPYYICHFFLSLFPSLPPAALSSKTNSWATGKRWRRGGRQSEGPWVRGVGGTPALSSHRPGLVPLCSSELRKRLPSRRESSCLSPVFAPDCRHWLWDARVWQKQLPTRGGR